MRTLIIATLLLLTPSVCQAGEPDKELHNKCIYPTVMIQGTNPRHGSTGTGVIIKSIKRGKGYINYVFTCAHVLKKTPARIIEEEAAEGEEPKPPKVIPSKYEYVVKFGVYEDWSVIKKIDTYKCNVIHVETGVKKDIALVTFRTDKVMPVAEINVSPKLYIGNEVCRIGCGLGEPFRVDFGKITSLSSSAGRPIVHTRKLYRTSIQTVMGDSGGPVYHENKLIGLAQMIRAMPANAGPFRTRIPVFHMSYVIPIKRFMDCKKITKHLKKSETFAPPPPPPLTEDIAPLPPLEE